MGGPVRKDKDFLFFAIEREREATSIGVAPTLYQELVLAEPLGAKPALAIADSVLRLALQRPLGSPLQR